MSSVQTRHVIWFRSSRSSTMGVRQTANLGTFRYGSPLVPFDPATNPQQYVGYTISRLQRTGTTVLLNLISGTDEKQILFSISNTSDADNFIQAVTTMRGSDSEQGLVVDIFAVVSTINP